MYVLRLSGPQKGFLDMPPGMGNPTFQQRARGSFEFRLSHVYKSLTGLDFDHQKRSFKRCIPFHYDLIVIKDSSEFHASATFLFVSFGVDS